jgi:hypothetical protein
MTSSDEAPGEKIEHGVTNAQIEAARAQGLDVADDGTIQSAAGHGRLATDK